MLEMLERHMDEVTALVLFGIGFTTLLLNKNLFKKIIGFSMMDSGIYLFLASYGYIESRVAPIYEGGITARYPDLPGCITCADTMEDAVANAVDTKKA